MRAFNSNKVFTEFRDKVTKLAPIENRKYTMTHSDTTGDLFVVIGRNYAEDKIEKIRDEVRLEWKELKGKLVLYGEVLIDGEGLEGNAKLRNAIFVKEMPLALKAIRYADKELFKTYPELDKTPVYIAFKSNLPMYNKVRDFGVIGRYRI